MNDQDDKRWEGEGLSTPLTACAVLLFVFFMRPSTFASDLLTSIPFCVGPLAVFFLFNFKDRKSRTMSSQAGAWLEAVFILTVGGAFYTGAAVLVCAILSVALPSNLAYSPILLLVIQFTPHVVLFIKKKKA